MEKFRCLGIGAAAIAMSVLASSVGATEAIKVGMVMPLTGALASNGKDVVAGAQLYMAQHGNVVAGRQVELIVRDDMTVPDVSKRLAQELLANDKVDLLAGGITAGVLAMAPLVSEAKKATVIMLSGTSGVIDKSSYFVRTSFTLAQSCSVMADWAAHHGIKKVVILVSDFAPGHEAESAFAKVFTARGGEIAETVHVPLQNPDFAPFLQRAKDAKPQAIFVFVPAGQGGTFARQYAERGLAQAGIKLIGPGDVTDDDVLPHMDDAIAGAITAHFYSAAHPSSVNKTFVRAFEEKYGYRPNFMAVSGYDGMHLIYEALRKTNGVTDGDTLVGAMKGMSWESPRGPMSIDAQGREVVHNIYLRKVEKLDGSLYNVEFATFGSLKVHPEHQPM
jgi:branched-chain amino acid transport system substrate-binding protein